MKVSTRNIPLQGTQLLRLSREVMKPCHENDPRDTTSA